MKSTIIQRLDVAISAAPSIVLHSNSPSAILSEMGRNGVYKASPGSKLLGLSHNC